MSKLVIILMYGLIPLSYFDFYGVRLISLALPLVLFFVFINKRKIVRIQIDHLIFLFVILWVSLFSFASGSRVLGGVLVFCAFYFWPAFFPRDEKINGMIRNVVSIYLAGAAISSIGVIVQRLLFEYFSLELGKIDFYGGNRIGFGFIWLDYSFLSLYIATSVPMVFLTTMSKKIKMVVVLLLVIGSATTTARTGLFALFMALTIYFSFVFLKNIFTFRFKTRYIKYFLIFTLILVLSVSYLVQYSTREFSFSGSGRFEGYLAAVNYVMENYSLGALFSTTAYKAWYSVIPHNVFLYVAVMGGVYFLTLILVWICSVVVVARKNSEAIRVSLLTAFFGLQLIPSIFSGYFVAALLGIAYLERLDSKTMTRKES